ncbi:MAG TPA: AGE family epimerase/isomerase [Nocardioides sp.]|nr:AGE family epimerase/isomerase [Nocardioides sp.]
MTWLDPPAHRTRLADEFVRLLDFGTTIAHPAGGAAWLDDHGRPDLERGALTWITCRMLHVHAIAAMTGRPGSRELAQRLLDGLAGPLRDPQHDGWFHRLDGEGRPDPSAGKSCYDHAFVLLGSSSAVVAGLDGADDLLAAATDVFLQRFWDDDAGRCRDHLSADWSELDPYRGLNANMHAVEAMLAVADATGDDRWRGRAARIAALVVDLAASYDGRLPEHFDEDWTPQPEHNRDRPADPFKPYGATVGHGLEWSRLLLHLEAANADPSERLLPTARLLFDRAVADGWEVDGAPGFVYTTDWSGDPVVHDRMHWVVAEALAAAAALWRRTGEAPYDALFARWWEHVEDCFVDREAGSWHHQLDARNRPATGVWPGKPDLYHAVQATLLPRLPLAPTLARAVRDGADL